MPGQMSGLFLAAAVKKKQTQNGVIVRERRTVMVALLAG